MLELSEINQTVLVLVLVLAQGPKRLTCAEVPKGRCSNDDRIDEIRTITK